DQLIPVILGKKAKFSLTTYKNSPISMYMNRSYDGLVGQFIFTPIFAIKGKQTFVIAEVHYSICPLLHIPSATPALENHFPIVDHHRCTSSAWSNTFYANTIN